MFAAQSAGVNDPKFESFTNTSVTSLADAIPQLDEQKTLPYGNCNVENAEKSSIVSVSKQESLELLTDLPELEDQNTEAGQTGVNERPGIFTKILRRMIGLFQGRKIDICPQANSMSFV